MKEQEFQLLLSFLNEHDEDTLSLVKDRLKLVLQDTPSLRTSILENSNPVLQIQGEMLLGEIWFEAIKPQIQRMLIHPNKFDLEKAIRLLANFQYPDYTDYELKTDLDKLAQDVSDVLIRDYPLPLRPIHVMCEVLFKVKGFKGNDEKYNDPDNTYINKVLVRRVGIPISLSVIYLLVAWRLNILAHGVGLPGHFIVGHRVPRGVIHVDPFNQGRILRKKDCEVLVRRLGFYFKEEFLDPVSNHQIFSRMVLNLVNIYTEQGATAKSHWMSQLFHLLQNPA